MNKLKCAWCDKFILVDIEDNIVTCKYCKERCRIVANTRLYKYYKESPTSDYKWDRK